MRIDTDAVYVTEVDGQAVILEAATSTYLTANEVGTRVIRALQADVSLAHLAAQVVDEFATDYDTALDDCRQFAVELDRRGWLLGAVE